MPDESFDDYLNRIHTIIQPLRRVLSATRSQARQYTRMSEAEAQACVTAEMARHANSR